MTTPKMLTADEARDLMRANTPDWHVEKILAAVKLAAERGESKLKSYACDFGSGKLYGAKPTALQQAVIDKLHTLGYRTAIRVEERQFVDIWLEVSWAAPKEPA